MGRPVGSTIPRKGKPPGSMYVRKKPRVAPPIRRAHSGIADKRTPDQILSDEIGKYYADPLGYVMFNFPWETEPSIQVVELAEGVGEMMSEDDRKRREAYRARFPNCTHGPDLWACDFLDDLGERIKKSKFNGKDPVMPLYYATVSGHEIGKSCLVAWLTKFILDTRPGSKGSLTAVTDEQLRTKTWAEVSKWHRMSLTSHWFTYNSSRGNMSLISVVNPEWRADARTCREEKSESFAGQHAPTATSFYIFDEASGIGSKIFDVREGGLSSGEPMVFDFGNGTRSSGPFYEECRGTLKHRYNVRSIDSRTVAITNKDKINVDIEDRGIDSDFVKVRWRGLFPDRSSTQFIPTVDVDEAMARDDVVDDAPIVIGVDVARFGDDDSVIWPRRGRDARSFPPETYHGLRTTELVTKVVEKWNYFTSLGTRPARIFVDGGGVGGGVVDQLRALGYPVTEVQLGSRPTDRTKHRFKSDELWDKVRLWLKGGVLPRRQGEIADRVHADLTQREYGYMAGGEVIHLETKDQMKARGLPSPDVAEALVVTFAEEVNDVPQDLMFGGGKVEYDYDPHAALKEAH